MVEMFDNKIQKLAVTKDFEDGNELYAIFNSSDYYSHEVTLVYNLREGETAADPQYIDKRPQVYTPLFQKKGDPENLYTYPGDTTGLLPDDFVAQPVGLVPPSYAGMYTTGSYNSSSFDMIYDSTLQGFKTRNKIKVLIFDINIALKMRTLDPITTVVGSTLYYAQYGSNLLTATPDTDLDFINTYCTWSFVAQSNGNTDSLNTKGTVIYATKNLYSPLASGGVTPPVADTTLVTTSGDAMTTTDGQAIKVTSAVSQKEFNKLADKVSKLSDSINSLLNVINEKKSTK